MSPPQTHEDRIRSYRDETNPTRYRLADVIAHTADVYRVSIADIVGPRRYRLLVRPRQCIAFVARQICSHMSYPQIGHALHRDHSTVIHNAELAVELFSEDADFRAAVLAVIARMEPIDRTPVPTRMTSAPVEIVQIPRTRFPASQTINAMSQEDRDEVIGEYYRTNIREGSAELLAALRRAMAA